ncbi:MAG: DUF4149 domain-containing protein [Orrella sp.]|uniref:DUF4149 domain-containing protein n=1 Tax=Orrella sp. TaxID=1921583 RepID=UPI003BCAABEB
MLTAALLVTALLFGGMLLFSFGFAAFVFSALPADQAGPTIRRAFPHFYIFVLVTSVIAAALLWSKDDVSAILLAVIAITTIPTRQFLMPAINRATDSGAKALFDKLHKLSVFITISHMVMTGVVLARFV